MRIIYFSFALLLSLMQVEKVGAQDARVEKFEKDFAQKVLSFPNNSTEASSV
jgi:hypothetical protein